MFKGYIYRHWIINDKGILKSYIGQTIESKPQKRWGLNGKGYIGKKDEKTTRFANAIRKYGWDNFEHEVIGIVEAETKEQLVLDLDEWEKYYIWLYDSFYNGYNLTTGGTNGKVHSEDTKAKISKSHIGKTHTEETKQKLSYILSQRSGEECAMYGKKHSEEAKQKMSKAKKGKYTGENNWCSKPVICVDTKEVFANVNCAKIKYPKGNITACCIGETISAGKHPETGQRLHWMYLKEYEKATEEEIARRFKRQEVKKRSTTKIVCTNTGEVFDNMREAIGWCGVKTKSGVCNCCQGKADYAGYHPVTGEKLHWMYYDEWLKIQCNN